MKLFHLVAAAIIVILVGCTSPDTAPLEATIAAQGTALASLMHTPTATVAPTAQPTPTPTSTVVPTATPIPIVPLLIHSSARTLVLSVSDFEPGWVKDSEEDVEQVLYQIVYTDNGPCKKMVLPTHSGWDKFSQSIPSWFAFLFCGRPSQDLFNADVLPIFSHDAQAQDDAGQSREQTKKARLAKKESVAGVVDLTKPNANSNAVALAMEASTKAQMERDEVDLLS